MKNKKSIIVIVILCLVIVLEICGYFFIKAKLNTEETTVFDVCYKAQTKFKNPATVKVVEATIYNNEYIILEIGGNNSFGAFVQSTYYVKDNTLYTKDDNYEIAREIINKCFEYEKEYNTNIVKLSEKSINKINQKLEGRYK